LNTVVRQDRSVEFPSRGDQAHVTCASRPNLTGGGFSYESACRCKSRVRSCR